MKENMTDESLVLYVYKCAECGHKDMVHMSGDREGVHAPCAVCGADVTLEWDGGTTFEVLPL